MTLSDHGQWSIWDHYSPYDNDGHKNRNTVKPRYTAPRYIATRDISPNSIYGRTPFCPHILNIYHQPRYIAEICHVRLAAVNFDNRMLELSHTIGMVRLIWSYRTSIFLPFFSCYHILSTAIIIWASKIWWLKKFEIICSPGHDLWYQWWLHYQSPSPIHVPLSNRDLRKGNSSDDYEMINLWYIIQQSWSFD